MGFVGCLLNPDPSEATSDNASLGDKFWYPLYEKLVELDIPGTSIRRAAVAAPGILSALHNAGSIACFAARIDVFKDFRSQIGSPRRRRDSYHWARFEALAAARRTAAANDVAEYPAPQLLVSGYQNLSPEEAFVGRGFARIRFSRHRRIHSLTHFSRYGSTSFGLTPGLCGNPQTPRKTLDKTWSACG